VTDRIRVALALGSGGARGYAHIGVIQVLEEQGCEIVGVSGTSMGALVGGLYAAGRLDAYTEWVSGLVARDMWRLLDVSVKAPGVIRGDRIMSRFSDLLEGAVIEDLPIPYTAVATDLLSRKEVWFQKGPVEAAIRASAALPTFMPPVMLHGRLLADGGMMNPVPIAPLMAVRADATVAVSLDGDEGAAGGPPVQESSDHEADHGTDDEWRERLRRGAAQVLETEAAQRVATWLRSARGSDGEEIESDEPTEPLYGDLPPGLGYRAVMEMSLDAMRSVVTRYRMASYPPDVLVTIPRRACRTLDFHRANEMIALGRVAAEEALARAELAGDE
jgi:NTE family protein